MKSSRIFFTFLIAFLIFGCSDNKKSDMKPENNVSSPKANSQDMKPAYGDMMIRGSIGDASVLLPVLASDSASSEISSLIYNGLVKYDKDINVVGELAERWEISDDNLKIRFYLRKGVTWQDGTPFTSKDVEYTFKIHIDPKTPTAYATDFLRVKEFRILDEHRI